MATLTDDEIELLDTLCLENEILESENFGGDLACWNWALGGLSKQMVWPEYIYGYISGVDDEKALKNVEPSKGGDWLKQNIKRLDDIREDYNKALGEDLPGKVIPVFSGRIAAVAADANKLQRTQKKTSYRLCMYSDPVSDTVTVPNFTHWWLDIEEICIELFPGMKHIQIYRGHQPINGHPVWGTYLHGLHDQHVRHIRAIISKYKKDIRRNSLPSGGRIVSGDPLGAPLDAALGAALEWRRDNEYSRRQGG